MSTRAAKRAVVEIDGSVLRWPGARQKFALFGEVVWIGVLMAVVCIPIVTWPAAVAAGSQHLRRFLYAESSSVGDFFRDVRRALPGGAVLGAGTALVGAVVAVDLALAAGGALPGGDVVGAVIAAAGAAGLVLAVIAAALWTPGTAWTALVRTSPRIARADVSGTLYSAAALGLAGVITWQWLPLGIPVLGMLTFALVAVGERRMVRLTRAARAD